LVDRTWYRCRVANAEDNVRGRCDLIDWAGDIIEWFVAIRIEDDGTIHRLRVNLVGLIAG